MIRRYGPGYSRMNAQVQLSLLEHGDIARDTIICKISIWLMNGKVHHQQTHTKDNTPHLHTTPLHH